jgi:hypothetical protein
MGTQSGGRGPPSGKVAVRWSRWWGEASKGFAPTKKIAYWTSISKAQMNLSILGTTVTDFLAA